MRLAWTSDTHLNFVDDDAIAAFGRSAKERGEALVITGDISDSLDLVHSLERLQWAFGSKIFYVLGNHDFYGSGIAQTEKGMRSVLQTPNFAYLTQTDEPSILDSKTALVGDDSWYDGRNGDIRKSGVQLADFYEVAEVAEAFTLATMSGSTGPLITALARLADHAVQRLRPKLVRALDACENVIVAMHVPPFPASSTYKGKPSDDNWLPYFSCKSMGNMLLEVANAYSERQILVLCGHSHGRGTYKPLPNLRVWTAEARYRHPKVNATIDTQSDFELNKK